MIDQERWGVWGGPEPAHWLAAHTGKTIVFPTREKAEEVAKVASLRGPQFIAKEFKP
jgi:hypothetical protein